MLRSKRVLEKVVYPSIERQAAASLKKKLAEEGKFVEKTRKEKAKREERDKKSRLVTLERFREVDELFYNREIDMHTLRVILKSKGGASLIAMVTGLEYKLVNDWRRSSTPESLLRQLAKCLEAYTANYRSGEKRREF
jgi:hypothetical protein